MKFLGLFLGLLLACSPVWSQSYVATEEQLTKIEQKIQVLTDSNQLLQQQLQQGAKQLQQQQKQLRNWKTLSTTLGIILTTVVVVEVVNK